MTAAEQISTQKRHHQVQRWTCWRCFRPIGEVRGDEVTIRRRGAEIVAHLPCTQTCPDCRTVNRWDLEEGKQAKP